jgi:hypothetical protein
VLEGTEPVFEWVKGTSLRPILNGLYKGRARAVSRVLSSAPAGDLPAAGGRYDVVSVSKIVSRRSTVGSQWLRGATRDSY